MNNIGEAIVCQNLSVGYLSGRQYKVVLDGINACFRIGDLTAIAGLNGAGKSTLLKTITGLLRPLKGDVLLFGKNISMFSQNDLARTVSLVLTDRPDDFYLTVFETVAAGRSPYTGFWGRLRKVDHTLIEKSLNYIGISHLKNRLLNSISDGERQKVMIAKALAQDTPIIILDEPAAFLDFPSKIELMHLLARLASEHQKTILFSSHDLDLIVRTADNVWLIGNGAPIVQGVPEMLLKNNSFSQSFGNNRLQYDTLLGQFQLNHNARGTYKVSNEVADSPLVRNALQRRGFMPSSDNQADVLIEMVEENIVVRLNGEIFTFENFEQLIYGIQKL
jgi:iron complex transport system ATP-binding protein